MKQITLEKVRDTLRDMRYEVAVPPEIAARAGRPSTGWSRSAEGRRVCREDPSAPRVGVAERPRRRRASVTIADARRASRNEAPTRRRWPW